MAVVKWEAFVDRGDLMPTQLDGLADNTLSAVSSELDNSVNLDTHMLIEFELDSVTFVSPAYFEVYMIKAPGGTNYETAPVIGGADRNTRIARIPIPAGASAQRVSTGLINLPPCKVSFYVGNQGGVTLNNSSPTNAMNVYTTNLASA